MHSNVTIENVSWPQFSWATLYIALLHCVKKPTILLLRNFGKCWPIAKILLPKIVIYLTQ